MLINYAHRGASGYYPENTMLAFEKAIELGASGIETDVHMTKDGYLVLMHDEQVDRTTNGKGYIKDFELNQLRKLDAGSWFDKGLTAITVPTIEELFDLVVDTKIILNIEIKTGIVFYPGIEQKLINIIKNYNMEKQVIFSSFNHYSMVYCKQLCSDIKTGLLYMEGLYKPELYCKQAHADAIHPNFCSINEEIVKAAIAAGIEVNPYTVNNEKDMKRLIAYGVSGIITNYPDKLIQVMEE